MLNINSLVIAALSALTFVSATPAAAELAPRANPSVQIWTSGACDSQPVYSGTYSSGTCHNFPNGGGKYGAKFQDSNSCSYKVWANQGCSGKATVHTQNGNNCIPIANNGDIAYYLPSGGASISITCN